MDYTAIVTTAGSVSSVLLSLGLSYWIFKVLSKIIEQQNKDFNNYKLETEKKMSSMSKEIETLKKSENKWFRKYHLVSNIIILDVSTPASASALEAKINGNLLSRTNTLLIKVLTFLSTQFFQA